MNLDELLGIDLTNPSHRLARLLATEDDTLVDRLVALRKTRGLSQKAVADAMGVSQSAIARIESGERDPRLSTLRRYAHAVGLLITHTVAIYDHERSVREQEQLHLGRLTSIPSAVKNMQPHYLRAALA